MNTISTPITKTDNSCQRGRKNYHHLVHLVTDFVLSFPDFSVRLAHTSLMRYHGRSNLFSVSQLYFHCKIICCFSVYFCATSPVIIFLFCVFFLCFALCTLTRSALFHTHIPVTHSHVYLWTEQMNVFYRYSHVSEN